MSPLTIVLIVILVLLIAACIALYIFGKRAEKKQAEQQEQMDAVAQTISMHSEIFKADKSSDRKSKSRTEDHDTYV